MIVIFCVFSKNKHPDYFTALFHLAKKLALLPLLEEVKPSSHWKVIKLLTFDKFIVSGTVTSSLRLIVEQWQVSSFQAKWRWLMCEHYFVLRKSSCVVVLILESEGLYYKTSKKYVLYDWSEHFY